MVNIAVLKVDPRGRVGIPTTFLKSNAVSISNKESKDGSETQ